MLIHSNKVLCFSTFLTIVYLKSKIENVLILKSVTAAHGEAEHVVRGLGHRVQWEIPPAMWYRDVRDGQQWVLGRPPKKYGSIHHIIHGTQVSLIAHTLSPTLRSMLQSPLHEPAGTGKECCV